MKGGYDLHGRYYPNVEDAINAEMSQCNEIDNRLLRQQVNKLERQQQQPAEQAYYEAIEYCKMLEHRIEQLEKLTEHLRPN